VLNPELKEPHVSSIKTLRIIAVVEAISFLVLIGASIYKYANDAPGGVHVMGPIHGVFFLAYVAVALAVASAAKWTGRTTIGVLAGAVLPFGGFAVDRWLAKQREPLAG